MGKSFVIAIHHFILFNVSSDKFSTNIIKSQVFIFASSNEIKNGFIKFQE